MKKRTAVIGALVSLMPMGQPLLIGSGAALTSAAVMFSVPEKANAESEEFYFKRANKKVGEEDYYGAISDYNKAIEINPKYSKAYINRGIAKDNLKDHYGAISDYRKTIEINPKYTNAYINRGITKEDIGDMKGACADWRKASKLGDEKSAKWVREQC